MTIPRKRGGVLPEIGYLEKEQMTALLDAVAKGSARGRRDHALLLFKASDDVLFVKTPDDNQPADQDYIHANTGANARRNYYGDFEYIVTLAPTRSGVPV